MKPKYQKIYDYLLEKIHRKHFRPGELLPSEGALMSEFEASRDTIRKTLNLLQTQGYIQKINGKGSVVLDKAPIELSFSGIRSFKEVALALPDTKIETKLITFQTKIDTTNILAIAEFLDKLKVQNTNGLLPKVTYVERLRCINEESIILDEDYLNAEIITDLTEKAAEDSLYSYIEDEMRLVIGYTHREITVIPATERDKSLLDMQQFDFLICVTSYTYLDDTRLFQFTRSKHRPDKFKFVDFARRK
ncbi:trehalose operon repressor [Thorsellia anophelis]|uniref:Trehalose operon repressor n=1 Tax=Thorsellia anophelis DSM 18579 TaxID=1123402 RepID=A0A1I0B966_9GAMM|nr:trehalose operon repressor [Thorsellia anophelis]SET03322.1 GntR family transcriptional regulator, trehalose operon transcriptional repressor [Thorsellia anophelis DSM 18579]